MHLAQIISKAVAIIKHQMSSEDKNSKGICRDFERGVCNRGNRCKFIHPDGINQPDQKLPICKDFQNKGCDRSKCKFLHITQDEEAGYNTSGLLPEHGGHPEQVQKMGYGKAVMSQDVCKDFLNNICQRGRSCRFRHVTEREYQLEKQLGMVGGGGQSFYGKRRRDDYGAMPEMGGLGEENEMLRRKITDLQRQVIDLRQMNDTLYDQNTRYRNQLRGGATPSATTDPFTAPAAYPSEVPPRPTAPAAYDGYTKF